MLDEMNPMERQGAVEPVGASMSYEPPASTSSPGRLIAVIASAFVLLVLAAVVVLLLLGQLSSGDTGDGAAESPGSAVAQTSQQAPITPAAAAVVVPIEPAPVPLTDVFTFRDIFDPLIRPPSESGDTPNGGGGGSTGGAPTDGSTEGTSTDNGSGASENTLLLQDITVADGEPTAVLVWEGETLALNEGDQVADSPWKVLEIRENSVVMLFGDTQVVLSVGQAISK